MPLSTWAARRPAARVRQVVNVVGLATPAGLLLARLGGAALVPGPDGLVLAGRTRRLPLRGRTMAVGDVVLTERDAAHLLARPNLLEHERRHAVQWAACLGLPFLPLYGAASGWSWLRARDAWSHNVFEQHAGLSAGGYLLPGVRCRDGSTSS